MTAAVFFFRSMCFRVAEQLKTLGFSKYTFYTVANHDTAITQRDQTENFIEWKVGIFHLATPTHSLLLIWIPVLA